MNAENANAEEMLKWARERYLPIAVAEIICAETQWEHLPSEEGYGSCLLSRDAEIVVGIEMGQQAVILAENKCVYKNIKLVQGSVLNIPIDVITPFKTIESVEEQKKHLTDVKRLLKDDGLFIISTTGMLSYSDDFNYRNSFIALDEKAPLCTDAMTSNTSKESDSNDKTNHRDKQTSELDLRSDKLVQWILEREQRIEELDSQLRISNDRIHELNCTISNMKQSIVWQILMKFQLGFVERALPQGTRRRERYDLALRGGRILVSEGWNGFHKKFIKSGRKPRQINAVTSENIVSLPEERNERLDGEVLMHRHNVLPFEIIYIETQMKLKEGNNLIRFHVREGGEKPCDIPEMKSMDSRCLSLAVSYISIWNETAKLPIYWGSNWHGVEESNGSSLRWLSNDATIYVNSDEDCNAKMFLQTNSFYRPRTLEIYIKDVQINCKFRKYEGKKFIILKGVESKADKNAVKKELDEIIKRLCGNIRS